jgi:ribbon-helix-helix protein
MTYNVIYSAVGKQRMGTKVRKQIYIGVEQSAMLKRMSEQTGLSESEIIRRALDAHIQALGYHQSQEERLHAWAKEREFIQSLIDAGPVPGGRTWTREDLYDRKIFQREGSAE